MSAIREPECAKKVDCTFCEGLCPHGLDSVRTEQNIIVEALAMPVVLNEDLLVPEVADGDHSVDADPEDQE